MSLLLRFLGLSNETPAQHDGKESLERIAAELEGLEPPRARLYACFAYVLARVADADLEFAQDEVAAMEETIVRCANIPASEASIVVRIARGEVERLGPTHNYIVTREFGRMSTEEERLQLLECLFAVAAADDVITGDESNEILLIAKEIGLSHADVLSIRSRFREKLAEMRPLRGERR